MIRRINQGLTALFVFMLLIVTAKADDVSFEFDIPMIPFPPQITEVTNSTAVAGSGSFNVYATIEGKTQLVQCCNDVCEHECTPDCDFSACELADFYSEADPRIDPNPTCIPNTNDTSGGANASVCGGKSGNPVVFYYYNGDTATTSSVDMTYNSSNEKFEASIPLTGLTEGDTVSYYIVAADNFGNVTAQVPDPSNAPCTTISSWDSNYQTPVLGNCSYANMYEQCGGVISGTPACYSSSYTSNDPSGDTCNIDGNVQTGLDLVDILGVSAGVGLGYSALPSDVVVCSKVKLGSNPPDIGSSSGEIDQYQISFYNPDIPDPNPVDVHFTNSYTVTYSPEVSGADPNLVKVLWDGDCMTDPNTADTLECKIFIGSLSEERLKIGASGSDLTFIVKNALPDGSSILGSSSNKTYINVTTGGIDLIGDTPYWNVDMVRGMSVDRDNKTVTVGTPQAPAAPLAVSPSECAAPGDPYSSGVCPKSTTEPANNECRLTINASPDSAFADEYKIYRNTENNTSTAAYLGSITTNLSGTNYYSDEITTLDGQKYYYFLTAVNSTGPYETSMNESTTTHCTVEDWVPPEPPNSMACATPDGNEGSCKCTWSIDTLNDPSITGFNITRDAVRQNTNLINAVENQASYEYSYTDNDEELEVMGGPYTYRAIATDAGGNESPEAGDDSDTALCTPEDFKKPSKIDTLTPALKALEYSVDLSWEQGEDEDLASGGGYNVYSCEVTVDPDTDCDTAAKYTKLNGSLIPHEGTLEYTASDLATEDTEFCFWVEACDNCVSQGTCPSNGSEANCSNFDTTAIYRKCLIVTASVDSVKPNMPGNVTATPPATGHKCDITFDRVCGGDDGNPFDDCNYPDATDLLGYYVLRTDAIGGDCSTTPIGNPGNLGSSVIANTVYASQQIASTLETTDDNNGEGLTNGTQYCYVVYGYDAGGNYSAGTPTPASCTPADTVAPSKPSISQITYDEVSCTPGWSAVSDPDMVTYNVYRCEGDMESCDLPGDFTIPGGGSSLTATTFSDYSVTTDTWYTYCIAAVDESMNESDVVSGAKENCDICLPTANPWPPSGVYAEPTVDQYGVKVWWTDSASDDSMGEGYGVYVCTGTTFGTCSGPLGSSYIDGDHDYSLGDPAYEFADAEISSAGSYYIAVTYKNTGISASESVADFSTSTVSLLVQDPIVCFHKTGTYTLDSTVCDSFSDPIEIAPGESIDIVGEISSTPAAGFQVDYDISTTSGDLSTATVVGDPDDLFDTTIETLVFNGGFDELAGAYFNITNPSVSNSFVLARITFNSDWSGTFSNDTDSATPTELTGDSSAIPGGVPPFDIVVSTPVFEAVGDLTGNQQVNAVDFGPLTDAWASTLGEPEYNPDADFNGDEVINLNDLVMMKNDYWEYATGSVADILSTNPIATLALDSSTDVENGQPFAVDFTVTYTGDTAYGLDAFIEFDPSMLQVTDGSGTLVTDVTDGSDFDNSMGINEVDNTLGRINLTYWNLSSGPATSGGTPLTVASFYFTPQATGSTQVIFSTDDSVNRKTIILGSDGATDITGTLATSTITIVDDLTAPVFSGVASAMDAETGDGVTLTWPAATDDSPPVTYNIYYSTTSGGQSYAIPGAYISATTSYTVTGLTADQMYYFVVRAMDSYGNEDTNTTELSATPTTGADTTPPSDPAYVYDGTSADVDYITSASSLSANWAASSDAESGVSAYWYAVGTTAGATDVVDWKSAASSSLSVTESGLSLTESTSYYFSVKAENGDGLYSSIVSSDGAALDTTAPSITITSPDEGQKTNTASLSVSGTTEEGASVTVNGTSASVNGTGFSATVSLSQGSNTITAEATDAAGNTGSDSVTVSYDGTAPVANITSPTSGSTTSGSVSVSGTASDNNFSSYTLEYGAGVSPSSWKQVTSSSTSVSAGSLGTIDMSYLSGDYTIRLTVNDDHGNSAQDTAIVTVTGNEITVTPSISASAWTQLSLPMELDSGSQQALLGSGDYNVYIWDPANEDDPVMGKYEKPASLSAGQGFWVKPVTSGAQLSLSGTPVGTTSDYEYSVGQGWNQVGAPFNWDFTWTNIKVKKNSSTYDYTDAVYTEELIAVTPFTHNGTSWSTISGTSMSAGQGYLLYVYESGVSLVYDPGSEDPHGVARIVRQKPAVEINISASGAHSADPDNRIGLDRGANDLFDGNDLFEPPAGFSQQRTSLYFPHDSWLRNPGKYTFDFRDFTGIDPDCPKEAEAGLCKVWDFTVETTETGTTMNVEWGRLPQLGGFYNLYLIDMTTGAEIDMLEQSGYSYTTTGADRSFQVVIVAKLPDMKTVSTTLEQGWNLVSVPVEPQITKALTLLGDDVDIMNVYQYFEDVYYSALTDGGVDIQSGIGYWIYVDETTEIDLEGVPSLPGLPVNVPIKEGWNLIGNPFEQALPWGDNIEIECNGESKSLTDAVDADWIGSKIYGYAAGGGYQAAQAGASLEPWKGYMLRAAADCELQLAR